MKQAPSTIPAYLETGSKRTFAGAIDWPGWCRSGRDEGLALQALFEYGPRYEQAIRPSGLPFEVPATSSSFAIVERLKGNATTDFGAPDVPPSADARPVGEDDLQRFQALTETCWDAFDSAVNSACHKQLRRGPRGGGRDLDEIVQHVVEAEAAYLSRLSWKAARAEPSDLKKALSRIRREASDALARAARAGVPEAGPRGGKRWTARYFVRRAAWHILDHAWEIEDRAE